MYLRSARSRFECDTTKGMQPPVVTCSACSLPNVPRLGRTALRLGLLSLVAGVAFFALAPRPVRNQAPPIIGTPPPPAALWGTAADWNTNPTGAGGTAVVPVRLRRVFQRQTATATQSVQLGAAAAAKGVYFTNTGTTLLEAATTSETLTIGTDGIIIASTAGAVTLGSTTPANLMPISITGSQTWTNNSTTNMLNVISAISDTTASTLTIRRRQHDRQRRHFQRHRALGLTMAGTGTLTLSAPTPTPALRPSRAAR